MLTIYRVRHTAMILALLLAAAACGEMAATPAAQEPDGTQTSPGISYVAGTSLFTADGNRIELDQAPEAPLIGWLSPVAVLSPDGSALAYQAYTQSRSVNQRDSFSEQGIQSGDPLGRPDIKVVDVQSGNERALVEGAHSLAWRDDDAFAYVAGVVQEHRANVPYEGHVVVRQGLDEAPEIWSDEPGRYVVAAWAGDVLLAYTVNEGERLDLVAFDGPGSQRSLATGASLVAVSPDGAEVLVEQTTQGSSVLILSVQDGSERSSLDLRTSMEAAEGDVTWLSYAGDWDGRWVVARGTPGLVLFDTADELRIVGVLKAPDGTAPEGLIQPQFVDGDVLTWATGRGPEGRATASVRCDLSSRACGPERDIAARNVRPVRNPSQP